MILNLSDTAQTAMAEALRKVIGRGADLCVFDDADKCLARLPLPPASVDGPNLVLGPIKAGHSVESGTANRASIVNAQGESVLEFDVGEMDAAMIMNSTKIAAGGPVEIETFIISVTG